MPKLDVIAAARAGLPDGEWTPEQVRQAMKQMAVASAAEWAELAWSRMLDGRMLAVRAVENEGASREDANAALARLVQVLQSELGTLFDRVANDIALTAPEDREALAIDCLGVFKARLEELVGGTPMGAAGHA